MTYPARWIDSTIKDVVLYGTYKARDQSMKSPGIESAYLDCDVRCLTVGLRIAPVCVRILLPDLRSIVAYVMAYPHIRHHHHHHQ